MTKKWSIVTFLRKHTVIVAQGMPKFSFSMALPLESFTCQVPLPNLVAVVTGLACSLTRVDVLFLVPCTLLHGEAWLRLVPDKSRNDHKGHIMPTVQLKSLTSNYPYPIFFVLSSVTHLRVKAGERLKNSRHSENDVGKHVEITLLKNSFTYCKL